MKDALGPDMKSIGKGVKVVETVGVKLKNSIVNEDLTGCYLPDCLLCRDGARGNHTRRGEVYSGECTIFKDSGVTATYDGETGHSGYQRINIGHGSSIVSNNQNNAFAKHFAIHYPEYIGINTKLKFSLTTFTKTCLMRQVTEGVMIHNCKATVKYNSKSEWHQPATRRVEFNNTPAGGSQ